MVFVVITNWQQTPLMILSLECAFWCQITNLPVYTTAFSLSQLSLTLNVPLHWFSLLLISNKILSLFVPTSRLLSSYFYCLIALQVQSTDKCNRRFWSWNGRILLKKISNLTESKQLGPLRRNLFYLFFLTGQTWIILIVNQIL